jgi:hypothetical protein
LYTNIQQTIVEIRALFAKAADAVRKMLNSRNVGKRQAAMLAITGVMGFAAVMASAPLTVLPTASQHGAVSAQAPKLSGGKNQARKTVAGLSKEQTDNARTIVEVGHEKGVPERGIVIALAVANQESNMKMLANDGTGKLKPDQKAVSQSMNYPHEGVGRDHGSVNFMQQQYPEWGTLDELMNPAIAASKFYDQLLQTKGWDKLPLTKAAQKVQRSAFPSAYADDEVLAQRVYDQIEA